MKLSLNRRKLTLILVYLLVLALLWALLRKHTIEAFANPPPNKGPIIKSFGTVLKDHPQVAQKALLFRAVAPTERRKLPSAFPGTDMKSGAWPQYLTLLSNIGNQGQCGSCWAWATTGILADRYSLLSNGKIKTQLSPGKMVMCTYKFSDLDATDWEKAWEDVTQRSTIAQKFDDQLRSQIACAGNDLYSALQELYTFGTMSEACVPYDTESTDDPVKYDLGKNSDPSNIPDCWKVIGIDFDTCADAKTAARVYRADDVYALNNNEGEIMQEIFRYGPVAAGFQVYTGFTDNYDGQSVYMGPATDSAGNITETVAGGHAVRIVGWGQEAGTNYWWIANSWSPAWGMNGYFRMKRGIAACGLENNVVGLKPEFPGPSVWKSSKDIIQAVDQRLRDFSAHKLDDTVMYYESAVTKIKNGTLKGDLKPAVTHDQLPNQGNYDHFWIADLFQGQFGGSESPTSSQAHTDLLFGVLTVMGVLGILLAPIN